MCMYIYIYMDNNIIDNNNQHQLINMLYYILLSICSMYIFIYIVLFDHDFYYQIILRYTSMYFGGVRETSLLIFKFSVGLTVSTNL